LELPVEEKFRYKLQVVRNDFLINASCLSGMLEVNLTHRELKEAKMNLALFNLILF
jgi:hypothetical protein